MTIKIYIPTFRRVGSQITFNSLPDKYKEKVILVVQRHERPQHNLDVDYLIVDDGIGIAETRKKIKEGIYTLTNLNLRSIDN